MHTAYELTCRDKSSHVIAIESAKGSYAASPAIGGRARRARL